MALSEKEKTALKQWADRMVEAYTIIKLECRTIYADDGDELLEPCGEPYVIKEDYGIHLSTLDNGSSLLNLAEALGINHVDIKKRRDETEEEGEEPYYKEFYFIYKGLRFFEITFGEVEDIKYYIGGVA